MLQEIPVESEILTREDLAKLLKCSTRHLKNMQDDGKLPNPFFIGDRAPRWRRQDVMAWIDSLLKPSQDASSN